MRLKLKKDEVFLLTELITFVRQENTYTDEDMNSLLRATLDEFLLKLNQLLLIGKEQYSFALKPTWGFALRLAMGDRALSTYAGITVQRICDKVHREYCNVQ
jgi:hypothetical protein